MAEEQFSFQRPPLDVQTFFNIFSSSHHEFVLNEEDEDTPVQDEIVLEQRKPATPIENAVRVAPKTIQELKSLIRERLPIRGDIESVTSHDQQELISILMSELSAVWPEMRNQAPDPFLSNDTNKELQRKVTVTVVSTVERLYLEYIEKLKAANLRKIFNPASNISRFKTQLAFEANKSLNILNIRRKLASTLRHPDEQNENVSEDAFVIKIREKLSESSSNKKKRGSIAKKLQMTRKVADQLYREAELEDLHEKMPVLNKEDLSLLTPMSTMRTKKEKEYENNRIVGDGPNENTETQMTDQDIIDEESRFRLHKSHSLPMAETGRLFLEELEINKQDISEKRKSSINVIKKTDNFTVESQRRHSKPLKLDPRDDLGNLIKRDYDEKKTDQKNESFDVEESMPPLLQAMPLYTKRQLNEGNKEKKVTEDDPMDDSGSFISTIPTEDALNPYISDELQRVEELPVQPSVVTKKIPNQGLVRTSDVRISNRQNASQITLKRHKTIYNNFKGEIDDSMVKLLDSNLFAGEEIKEVYEEVSKTIKKVHLQFEKDDFVVNCPQSLDVDGSFVSQLLQNTKVNKVANPNIVGLTKPPWDSQGADEWRNSPKFGGLGRQEILQLKENAYKELVTQETSYDKTSQRKPAKSYSAWLAWWRSTINSEDYYKYISNKDNDFLSKAFHLYDSCDEDEDADLSQKTIPESPEELARRREIEEKQGKLQAQKDEYNSGYWNVNTVLLGGLGKSPLLEDVNPVEDSSIFGASSTTASSGQQLLSTISKSIRTANFADKQSNASSTTIGIEDTEDLGSELLQPPEITVQDRLERIWDRLRMPENLRLDMAIKYSLDKNSKVLPEAIIHWETAVSKICEREELIAILEKFERAASDPNRFFQKGRGGSSLSRLDESKTRDSLHKRLHQLDISAKKAVEVIQTTLKDIVTYEGRPYLDKLSCDKIEMLYWLQQERRITSLETGIHDADLRGKISELPPISTLTLL